MLKMLSIDRFSRENKERGIILIGAGKRAKRLINKYNWNYKYAIDNNPEHREPLRTLDRSIPVFDWDYLKNNCDDDDIIVITPVKGYEELLKNAEDDVGFADIYVFDYMEALQWDADRINESQEPFIITKGERPLIPKRIHYFWFSGGEYPDKVKKCIDSWHKYCPEYEFRRWSLDNYKTDNAFFNEALSRGAWSIASDYSRSDVIYRFGGIYLDVDVELIRPLDDLLYDKGFFCFQGAEGIDPGSGMAAVSGHKIFKDICDKYDRLHYIMEDGSEQYEDILFQYNSVLEQHGIVKNGCYQIIEDIAIYPPLVFSPYSSMTGIDSRYEMTYGVHHWVSAWLDDEVHRFWNERKRVISGYAADNGGIGKLV